MGGIQPSAMRRFANDTVDDGLIQRLLPVLVQPGTPEIDLPVDMAEYSNLVGRFCDHRRMAQVTLRFSPEAQITRNNLATKHLEMLHVESINGKLASHIGKYDGIFARLCLLFHCIENVDNELPVEISAETAKRVEKFLHGFLFRHAIAFYSQVLGMSDTHSDGLWAEVRRHITEWVSGRLVALRSLQFVAAKCSDWETRVTHRDKRQQTRQTRLLHNLPGRGRKCSGFKIEQTDFAANSK